MIKFKVTDPDIQSVKLVLQKVLVRFEFIRTFILNLLNCFLGYLELDEKSVSLCKALILKNINNLLLSKKSNIRGLSWYLVQLINSNDLLPRAHHLIEKIKGSKLDEQIDTALLQHHITKKVEQIPADLRPTGKEDDFLCMSDQEFFSREFQIIIPEFSDNSTCSKFLEDFKFKQITSMRRLLKEIKRFGKLMTISHTKRLYYSVELLNILEDWMSRNFGMIEIEFQINILRMIVGNLEDTKVLIHLLLLENFSKAEKDNNFMQLFINSLTVDIDIGGKPPNH